MTISEIARLAGVSNAAVSRYLNGGSLSAEKREKIRQVVQQHSYVPNAHAQMMRTKRNNLVGVIVPKLDTESMPAIVDGVSRQLGEAGYTCILANTDNSADKELEYLERFAAGSSLAGVIFCATVLTTEHRKRMSALGVPLVVVGQEMAGHSCVYFDDQSAARSMAAILLERCRGPLGYLGVTDQDRAAGAARRQGVLDALAQSGRGPECLVEERADFTVESGWEAARRLLVRSPQVDSIFCATDLIAVGAMKYLREIGKAVPDEVQVTGIGGGIMADIVTPRLTTARYYYQAAGREAARLLLGAFLDWEQPVKNLRLGYEVIRRETTR